MYEFEIVRGGQRRRLERVRKVDSEVLYIVSTKLSILVLYLPWTRPLFAGRPSGAICMAIGAGGALRRRFASCSAVKASDDGGDDGGGD